MLSEIIKNEKMDLAFGILNIGALPIKGQTEPSYRLLNDFPGSQVIAFEVSEEVCEKLNREGREGLKYYSAFLGRAEPPCPPLQKGGFHTDGVTSVNN